MKPIELWYGDCLELMKNIPDGSVDLTVTSPPYDNLRTYNGNIDQWNFENRHFIGIELDEGYFDIAEKRINEAQNI